jgi:SAM-dependent methyltransferase
LYRRLRGRRTGKGRPQLLELGAGGGHILSHLCGAFDCTALDLSTAMLDQCSRLVPGIEIVQADMRTCRLGRRFDLVLLLDAVDYMSTPADAQAALATAAAHLEPGGVLFVAPTYTRETFIDGETASDTAPSQGVTYLSQVHVPDPAHARYELILVYLVRNAHDGRVDVIEDRHMCGLFGRDEWLQLMDAAGFDARRLADDKAWSLFGATLRATEDSGAERRSVRPKLERTARAVRKRS